MANVTTDPDSEQAAAVRRRYLVRFEEDMLRPRPKRGRAWHQLGEGEPPDRAGRRRSMHRPYRFGVPARPAGEPQASRAHQPPWPRPPLEQHVGGRRECRPRSLRQVRVGGVGTPDAKVAPGRGEVRRPPNVLLYLLRAAGGPLRDAGRAGRLRVGLDARPGRRRRVRRGRRRAGPGAARRPAQRRAADHGRGSPTVSRTSTEAITLLRRVASR